MTQSIKDLIPSVISELSKKRPSQLDISEIWQRVSKGGKGSRVVELKKDQLIVVVDSSARKMHFFRQRQEILEEIQSKMPQIKNIYFKVGSV